MFTKTLRIPALAILMMLFVSAPVSSQTTFKTALESLEQGHFSYDSAVALGLSESMQEASSDSLLSHIAKSLDSLSSQSTFDLTYRLTSRSQELRIHNWKRCIAHIASLTPFDTINYCKAYNYLGSTYSAQGKRDSALHSFIHVIEFLPPDLIDEELAVAHNNAGAILDGRDDPQGAMENYKRARDIFKALLGDDHYYIGIIENNIGQALYKLGRFEEQIQAQESSKRIYLNSLGRLHKLTGNIYLNLGIAYRAAGDHNRSIDYLQQAIDIRAELQDNKGVIAGYSEVASTMAAFNDIYSLEELITYQSNAIKQGQSHVEPTDLAFKSLYNNYALSLLEQGDLEEALRYLHMSMYMRYSGVNLGDLYSTPSVRDINTPSFDDYKILENTAYVLYQIYNESQDTSALRQSIRIYQAGDSIMMQLRTNLLGNLSRNRLIRHAGDYYINAATSALEMYWATEDLGYLDICFEWTEKSSNWNLTDRYARTARARSIAESSPVNNLQTLDSLSRSDVLEFERLKSDFPEYFNFIYGQSLADLDDVSSYCKKHHTQWLYRLPMNNDRYSTLLVTPDTLFVRTSSSSKDSLAEFALATYDAIEDRSWDFALPAHSIYQMTVGPHADDLSEWPLIISGFNTSSAIPWDALPQKHATEQSEIVDSYLGNKYSISTMPSATYAITTDGIQWMRSAAFIAPQYASEVLSYNVEEATIGATNLNGTLIDEDIDGTTFTEYMQKYDLIHFAGHSVTHPDELDSIYMLLGEGYDTLRMTNLMSSRSSAKLAVLGSCSSFDGKYSAEGIQGLNYAMSFAGTPNVISSLWAASDRESNELFELFYQHMSQGMPSSAALSHAKQEYLQTSPLPGKHPFYWANWTYQGHSVFYYKAAYGYWVTTTLGLLGFAAFTAFYLRARKSSSALEEKDELPADSSSNNS